MTMAQRLSRALWLLLVLFFAWDLWHSPPINLRLEPPLIAAGSGQSNNAGHCSMAGKLGR